MSKLPVPTRGDIYNYTLTFSKKDGSPRNITGLHVIFCIKSDKTMADEASEVYVDQTNHTDGANGLSAITVTMSLAYDINYLYFVRLVGPGVRDTVDSGSFQLSF